MSERVHGTLKTWIEDHGFGFIIPDNGLELDLDANRVQSLGQPERVGVRSMRREQFGSDGDYFSSQH